MRKVILVLALAGLCASANDASAFFCKKKKAPVCCPVPVVTSYSAPVSGCGTSSYPSTGYYGGTSYGQPGMGYAGYPQSGNYYGGGMGGGMMYPRIR